MKKVLKGIGLTLLILILAAAGIYYYARYIEPNELQTDEQNLIVPDSVPEGKIVFFSDTHFGKLYSEDHLAEIVKTINDQNPDLVIFGGDLIDNYNRDKSILNTEKIIEQFGQIQSKYGKYAIYGNHDYGGGAELIYKEIMTRSGFTILTNESQGISQMNLRLTGYDDLLFGYTPASDYSLSGDAFTVILSHEPDTVDRITIPSDAVMLSGHSHGGQVTIPFLTEYYLPDGATEYIRGWYNDKGKSSNIDLFVSRGIGMTTLPFRFLSEPEISVINLVHG